IVKLLIAGCDLPFAALQLLAPPVRLVSAALWKVLKRRDVMQYGVVEEFVTSSCEAVPGLLTVRHQGRLTVGLRARVSITGEASPLLLVKLAHKNFTHMYLHTCDVTIKVI
uniref:TERF1-interacting nuclear factor 2 N-terminal domain-containing protein n=1 Tax=Pundamilia nyererei TaxID=303518 RepID=A0A3B4F845_9CICH